MEQSILVLEVRGCIASFIPVGWNGKLASGLGRARDLLLVGELAIVDQGKTAN